MVKWSKHLPSSNRSNLQVEAASTVVTDIIKESVLFIVVYCFFTVGSVKFLQLSFVTFFGEELTEFGFVREECQKTLRITGLDIYIFALFKVNCKVCLCAILQILSQ